MLYYFQKGFNYSQDGPGNRLVFHLSGCSLQCPWCSNPEGKNRSDGTPLAVEDLVKEAASCKPMFFDGGGVTFTGGEATEQYPALEKALIALKEAGISTCLETNGTHPGLPRLFPYIDHLIMDIKHFDPDAHREVIGCSLKTVTQNIRAAGQRQLALRIPLIGGFNDQDPKGFAKLLHSLDLGQQVTLEVLRYHEYGKDKYEKLGIPYPMTDRAKISPETYRWFVEALKKENIQIIHT